jgi:flagellar protein FlaG
LKIKEDNMIEDIVKTQDFNNASTVEVRRGSNPAPQAKEIEKKVDAGNAEKHEDKNIKEALDKISSVANSYNRKIRIEVDKDLDIMIVKVIDGDTDQVIRQIPAQELIELSKHAKDQKGLLINKEG